jgi:general stress protein YciG
MADGRRRTVNDPTDDVDGNMSVREAGRKGGKTTRARYGPEFFQQIGAKGGKAVSERYSNEHFREIGRKGGRRVAELIALAKRLDAAASDQEE